MRTCCGCCCCCSSCVMPALSWSEPTCCLCGCCCLCCRRLPLHRCQQGGILPRFLGSSTRASCLSSNDLCQHTTQPEAMEWAQQLTDSSKSRNRPEEIVRSITTLGVWARCACRTAHLLVSLLLDPVCRPPRCLCLGCLLLAMRLHISYCCCQVSSLGCERGLLRLAVLRHLHHQTPTATEPAHRCTPS